jgi:hypothetical protein
MFSLICTYVSLICNYVFTKVLMFSSVFPTFNIDFGEEISGRLTACRPFVSSLHLAMLSLIAFCMFVSSSLKFKRRGHGARGGGSGIGAH